MKSILALLLIATAALTITSCKENYVKGERVGMVTKFSKSGLIWDSYEGELHVTQTGMNSSMNEFEFSLDNNKNASLDKVIWTLDSAVKYGWKVRLMYHECLNKNMTGSRGDTDTFVDSVEVVDRHMETSGSLR